MQTLKAVADKLDTQSQIGLRGISSGEAQAILDAPALQPCGDKRAVDCAEVLLGLYPAREVNSPTVFVAGLSKLLSVYPAKDVVALIDPVTGLASSLKWPPTLAECKAFLEAIATRRTNIIANAHFVIDYHRRRQAEAEADAKYYAEQAALTPEMRTLRAAKVAALLSSMKANTEVIA